MDALFLSLFQGLCCLLGSEDQVSVLSYEEGAKSFWERVSSGYAVFCYYMYCLSGSSLSNVSIVFSYLQYISLNT